MQYFALRRFHSLNADSRFRARRLDEIGCVDAVALLVLEDGVDNELSYLIPSPHEDSLAQLRQLWRLRLF